MKAIISALFSASLVSGAIHGLQGIRGDGSENIVPNAFIVELEGASILEEFGGNIKRSPVAKGNGILYQSLKERGVQFDVTKEWTTDVFTAVSLVLNEDADASDLLSMPGVVAVHPVRTYAMPKPAIITESNNNTFPIYEPHIATGVQRLHEEGLLGKGVKIAIIDTGVDYNHPILGPQGFGPGHKVIGGYDLVGDDYTGLNTPIPDTDPMDCAAHGTHVAGIIGANPGSSPYGIVGTAPSASLLAYRVFGCKGSASDDILIDALLMAHDAKADVMNLSLGEANGWNASPSAVVVSRLATKGYVMVISAGNSGSVGPWYSSSPASGIDVITVASTDSTTVYYQRANVSTGYGPIVYTGFESLPVNGSWPIYAISNVTTITNDACNPLPDSTPDLSPYVVIIRRGTCAFTQKLANAAAKGMRVALVYNNGGSFQGLAAGNYTAALISEQDGAYLVSQFVAGNNITISFPQGSAQPIPFPQGGLISTFSSYGPNYDLYLKPSIAAPGGGILSSIPSGKYAIYSGTSMAAPYISGSAALALEAHGVSRDTGKTIRTLFEATASHLGSTHDETAPYETLIRQGSGLVQVYNAIRYNTIVDRPEILLNDSVHFDHKYPIGFQNTGNTTLSYTIGHIPAGTATTFNTSLSLPISGAAPLSTTTATLSFSQTTFTLGPGKKTKITVTVEPPSGLDPKSFPIYSGWITATGSNGEVVSVPYMGLAASVKDMNVLDRSDYYFGIPLPALLDAKEDPQTDLQNYTFANDNNPTLLWRQAAGTAVQRIDLVDAASNVTFTKRSPGSFAAVPILGTLQEKAYVPRNSLINDNTTDWNKLDWKANKFSNGTSVPNGTYRMLLRVLKITGDPTDQADYESYLSPAFGVITSA